MFILKNIRSFAIFLLVLSMIWAGAFYSRSEAEAHPGALKFEGRAGELSPDAGAAAGDLFVKMLSKSNGGVLVTNKTTTIRCPYCKSIRSGNTLRNSQITCKGCGATIAIDNDGHIKWTKPKK